MYVQKFRKTVLIHAATLFTLGVALPLAGASKMDPSLAGAAGPHLHNARAESQRFHWHGVAILRKDGVHWPIRQGGGLAAKDADSAWHTARHLFRYKVVQPYLDGGAILVEWKVTISKPDP